MTINNDCKQYNQKNAIINTMFNRIIYNAINLFVTCV
jgi:hypothetical protein